VTFDMSVPLSRPFPSRYGVPIVDRVDVRMFTLTYFTNCMECTFCSDACCQYGADIERDRMTALDKIAPDLEAYLGVPRAEWFRDDPDDVGILAEPEYPGGEYTRTNVVELPAGRSPHNEWACVFLDPVGRGCRIHRYALERGIDVHDIKPMVCLLFPLSFDQGLLKPAYEFEVDDLICQGPGPTLYQAARDDVRYYFGDELVAELDALAAAHPPTEPVARAVSLPVCSA
jgi:Fe-S-cluster containining protein